MLPAAGKKIFSRGFTLIELLIVIAILGILSGGVFIAINPLKRINQAKDSKIKNDVGQLAQALQAYYTTSQYYPTALSDLVTSGDLKITPTGYSYYRNSNCATSPYTGCEAVVYATLNDPVATGNVWCWRSATNVASEVSSAGGPPPTACSP